MQGERFRLHRRRLAAAVKVALVMVLLEARTGWFFIYFFAVLLYIAGLFDPFIDWFRRAQGTQTTLEQQLANLRTRTREAEAAAAAAVVARAAADAAAAAAAAAGEPAADAGASGHSEREAEGSSDAADSGGAAASGAGASGGETGEAVEQQPEGPPYWTRFGYQLVVMFFMTLIPWWNPNPRYL